MANRVHCKNCGRDGHAEWQCTRPKKSTASRKDVKNFKPDGSASETKPVAGTQAPPVDNSRTRKKALAGEMPSVNEQPEAVGKLVQVQQSGPATKFDKTAYQREYVARWRRGEVGNKHRIIK